MANNTKPLFFIRAIYIGLFLPALVLAQQNDDDILDLILPIIAAAADECQSITTIRPNCKLIVATDINLNGSTVELTNVTIEYDGGTISNGTLNFNGGQIDGNLLNSSLTIKGDVSLLSNTFIFYPERWDIAQGETTSAVALSNNHNLEALFEFIKSLGATTFKIDKFDAYFHSYHDSNPATAVVYTTIEAINVPSDFNLVMTNNTHLRVFPGTKDQSGGNLMALRDVENVTITGGILHGDRDTRAYPAGDIGAIGSHLLRLHSARNVTIKDMTFLDASAGSLNIFSLGFRFNPDTYIPSTNITVQNNLFKNSRRMSIALTDGDDIQIVNNKFIDNDQDSTNSTSGEVGYAINIEPSRTRDDEGSLIEYELVYDVLIKGNTERNSRSGFLSLYAGQDITVEDNNIGTRMSWNFANGARYINNTFAAIGDAAQSWAFFASGTGDTVYDNEFSGNSISGYSIGVVVGSVDADIFNNEIKNVGGGIQVSNAIDARIYNNVIEAVGDGIRFANTTADNVQVTGNTVTTSGFMARVTNSNNQTAETNFSILIDDNDFLGNGAISLFLSNGVTFSNNMVNGGIQISDTSNSVIDRNVIRPNESHGIRLYNTVENITLSSNTIYQPTGADRFECLSDETISGNVTSTNNSCN